MLGIYIDDKFIFRALVSAYDHPLIWKGHSSIIDENSEDLKAAPDAIFCSVGGGGLLGGVIEGCKRNGWDDGEISLLKPSLSEHSVHFP